VDFHGLFAKFFVILIGFVIAVDLAADFVELALPQLFDFVVALRIKKAVLFGFTGCARLNGDRSASRSVLVHASGAAAIRLTSRANLCN
jgi:hypothetical protein